MLLKRHFHCIICRLKGCKAEREERDERQVEGKSDATASTSAPTTNPGNQFECSICGEKFNFVTAVEKLRHRNKCQGRK